MNTTNCLRCGSLCHSGTPDPNARAIVQAARGYCANCMIEKFLTDIEIIRELINGTPARGGNPARTGLGPEIFLNATWRENVLRPLMATVLSHTQMPEDAINWIEVVSNWGTPYPAAP